MKKDVERGGEGQTKGELKLQYICTEIHRLRLTLRLEVALILVVLIFGASSSVSDWHARN